MRDCGALQTHILSDKISEENSTREMFADMFTGWVYNSWEVDVTKANSLADAGTTRKNFMDDNMPD